MYFLQGGFMEWIILGVLAFVGVVVVWTFMAKPPVKCCECEEKCDEDCECEEKCGYQCKICYPPSDYTAMPPM